MNRSLKAIANRCVFANRKDRNVICKANDRATAKLAAPAASAFYRLCGSLRGLLRTATTGTHAPHSTKHCWSWMSGMHSYQSMVRCPSPVVVRV